MKEYDREREVYWEINFYDLQNGKLADFYGNTDDESNIDILVKKAKNKGYDTMEVVKVTKKTKRYNL